MSRLRALWFLVACAAASAQTPHAPAVPVVSRTELADDLDVLQRALRALHPGLTLHNTEADLDAIWRQADAEADALGEAYSDAIPVPDAFLAVTETVAALRDGHTQVSLYNQREATERLLYDRADRVPFTFRLVGDRMVVTGDATADRVLPRGTEILSLDRRPVRDVLAALLPTASADGDNDAKRLDELEGADLLAPALRFDVAYSLRFRPDGDLALTVRQPDGAEAALTVPRTTAAARRDTLWARDPALPRRAADLLRVRVDDDGTAVLTIGTFFTYGLGIDYAEWLVGAFRQIHEAGAERLVVDLRDVAGGMTDAAVLLFTHLLTEPVEVTLWANHAAYDRVPDGLRPYLTSYSDDFLDLSGRVTRAEDGIYALPSPPPTWVPPAPDAFTGPTAVLVDATASSATFKLADVIQETGAALLVGQETGGNLRGINAGQVVFLTLPHSGIVVDVPLFGSRPPEPGPDRGVVPDVLVPPDADAVIAGRDAELEAAVHALTAR